MHSYYILGNFEPEAIEAVIAEWKSDFPELGILILLPEAEHPAVPAIQLLCRTLDVPMMGAIFPALITETGFKTDGVGLVRFDICPPWFLVSDIGLGGGCSRLQAAVNGLAGPSMPNQSGRPQELFLIFDGILPNIASLLDELFVAYQNDFNYSGIGAGSETFKSMPCLFDQRRLLANGAIGIRLPQDSAHYLEHGYPVGKSLMEASSTTGNRIFTINYQPALTVYREVLRRDFGIMLTPDNFYEYAVHYPFGLITAIDVLVRIPVGFDSDGSITCVGEIPPNVRLRLIKAPLLAQSDAVSQLATRMNARGQQDSDLLLFYCAGRRMHMGEQAASEVDQFGQMTAAKSLLGALTLGEINTETELGFPRFHNAAMVGLYVPSVRS